MTDLALIWAGILAFAVYAYVVLDGFDLGIGILVPFARSQKDEETMISAIAPVWDGNETWLVLGGGGLLAAFPLAYSILLPALYAPLIAMLLALASRSSSVIDTTRIGTSGPGASRSARTLRPLRKECQSAPLCKASR